MLTRVFFLQSTFVWFGTSASDLSGDPSIYLCMCMSSSWLVTQFSHAAACLSVLAHNCSAGLVCIVLPCADLWWRGSVRFHNTCWPKHPTWSPSTSSPLNLPRLQQRRLLTNRLRRQTSPQVPCAKDLPHARKRKLLLTWCSIQSGLCSISEGGLTCLQRPGMCFCSDLTSDSGRARLAVREHRIALNTFKPMSSNKIDMI